MIFGSDNWFYVLTRRFKCSACNVTYNGYHSGVLDQLPLHIRRLFPVVLTRKSGVSLDIIEDLRFFAGDPAFGGADAMVRLLTDRYKRRWIKKMSIWASKVAYTRERDSQSSLAIRKLAQSPERWKEDWKDSSQYCGRLPTANYLNDILKVDLLRREAWQKCMLRGVSAKVLDTVLIFNKHQILTFMLFRFSKSMGTSSFLRRYL